MTGIKLVSSLYNTIYGLITNILMFFQDMELLPLRTLRLENSCLSTLEDTSLAWKEKLCSKSTWMQMQPFCISTPLKEILFGKEIEMITSNYR